MDFKTFYCGKDDEGRRLDRIVRKFLSEESLSILYKSIRNGFIKVNKKTVSPSYRVRENDALFIASSLAPAVSFDESAGRFPPKERYPAFSKENTIFKNEAIIVINKPYDVSVQGKNSLSDQIVSIWKGEEKTKDGSSSLSFIPGPLHRLDRKTTGVLIFSQNLKGAQWFSSAFKHNAIKKIYLALLQGRLDEPVFWHDSIVKKTDNDKNFHTVNIVSDKTEAGKAAVTKAEPLYYGIYENLDVTLAKITIETGRTHQIRSQAAFHGFPLLGDTAYGGKKITADRDFYLHSYALLIPENNPLSVPKKLIAFIPTKFEKMLSKTLISPLRINII